MKKKYFVILTLFGLIVSLAVVPHAEQAAEQFTVLVVDETESMEFSMRIQAFVGALKGRPEVKVVTRMFSPESPLDNPLKDPNDLKVDAVLIFPRTIETEKVQQVWIVTPPLSQIPLEMRAETASMMEQLKDGIEKAFSGKVNAVGVDDDVIPAYFSTLFLKQGVLR